MTDSEGEKAEGRGVELLDFSKVLAFWVYYGIEQKVPVIGFPS
ncbi:hypothetical protein [Geomonas diazotrophica]|nr:hypothetical protein [Geomonas nitrogeniifigens]